MKLVIHALLYRSFPKKKKKTRNLIVLSFSLLKNIYQKLLSIYLINLLQSLRFSMK